MTDGYMMQRLNDFNQSFKDINSISNLVFETFNATDSKAAFYTTDLYNQIRKYCQEDLPYMLIYKNGTIQLPYILIEDILWYKDTDPTTGLENYRLYLLDVAIYPNLNDTNP